MKLTRKRAKELCIKKWEYIVKNKGGRNGLYDVLPELRLLLSGCAYCELYLGTRSKTLDECAKCLIRPKVNEYDDLNDLGCSQRNHPFFKWENAQTTKLKIKYAKELLELIKKS